MKRAGQSAISHAGTEALNQYQAYLQHTEDMSLVTTRNYLSDLRQFIAWCEATWQEVQDGETGSHSQRKTSASDLQRASRTSQWSSGVGA